MPSKKLKKVLCHDINGNKIIVPVSKLSFRPSVYGVIIEKDKVLLSKQWDGYDFPGGGQELGETIEEALLREVWEETGVRIKIGKILACENSFFKLPSNGQYVQAVLMYFKCKKIGGKLSVKNFGEGEKKYADMPEWIDIKRIGKLKFYNPVDNSKIIKEAIK